MAYEYVSQLMGTREIRATGPAGSELCVVKIPIERKFPEYILSAIDIAYEMGREEGKAAAIDAIRSIG